jgi:hypothetical protein
VGLRLLDNIVEALCQLSYIPEPTPYEQESGVTKTWRFW